MPAPVRAARIGGHSVFGRGEGISQACDADIVARALFKVASMFISAHHSPLWPRQ